MKDAYATAQDLARKIRGVKGVSDVLIPQDLDYPGISLDVESRNGGAAGPVVARKSSTTSSPRLTSNGMIAPSYWVDPKNGNNYMLTVQYPETQVKSLLDLKQIPMRASEAMLNTTRPGSGDQHRRSSIRRPRSTTTSCGA